MHASFVGLMGRIPEIPTVAEGNTKRAGIFQLVPKRRGRGRHLYMVTN